MTTLKQFPGFEGIVDMANAVSKKTVDTTKVKKEDET